MQNTLWSIKNVTPFYFSQGSVETFFRWSGKRIHYLVAHLFRTLYSDFDQNQPSFTKDTTKTFWLSVYWDTVLEFPENTTYKFYKVVERHYSGEVGNITALWRQISSWMWRPIIMKLGWLLTQLFVKKGWRFYGSQCSSKNGFPKRVDRKLQGWKCKSWKWSTELQLVKLQDVKIQDTTPPQYIIGVLQRV